MALTPEQLAKAGTEHAHQCAVFLWMQQHKHIWPELVWAYAIPNGGARDIRTASKLKAEGVKSGVSDICIPVRRGLYSGFYLEMKKPGCEKNESEEQKKFGVFVATQGYLYLLADHWAVAIDYIARYMEVDPTLKPRY